MSRDLSKSNLITAICQFRSPNTRMMSGFRPDCSGLSTCANCEVRTATWSSMTIHPVVVQPACAEYLLLDAEMWIRFCSCGSCGIKSPGFSSDWQKCPSECHPKLSEERSSTILGQFWMALRQTFLARVTREPGDFSIITQEFRFATLVYKPYRHNEQEGNGPLDQRAIGI